MRHVAIVPARNEERFITPTLESLLGQTEPPDRVYVVDDGSSDGTAGIVLGFAARDPRVVLVRREQRRERRMGGGVVDAFNAAYALCRGEPFTYVSKLDADQVLPPDYFARVLGFLDAHPDWATTGGVPYEPVAGMQVRWRMPATHVPGSLKTIRKDVFDRMGGFVPVLGWDIVDGVKMRSMGYRTGYLDLPVEHLRQHGSAEGKVRGKVQWGEGAWIIGSHPLFVVARGIYRMREPPFVVSGLAFWWGYVRAALRRTPRMPDAELVRAVRREQVQRLTHFNRLRHG
ncbi:MAG TPA: glycosyltransferase family A protein [Longimicrobium sp.]